MIRLYVVYDLVLDNKLNVNYKTAIKIITKIYYF
jgi:hypothetical protein